MRITDSGLIDPLTYFPVSSLVLQGPSSLTQIKRGLKTSRIYYGYVCINPRHILI